MHRLSLSDGRRRVIDEGDSAEVLQRRLDLRAAGAVSTCALAHSKLVAHIHVVHRVRQSNSHKMSGPFVRGSLAELGLLRVALPLL